MIPLMVTATLRSPMHLGLKNTSAYFVECFRYIPGRALLGAAAWAWMDEGGDPKSSEFAARFLSGAVSWGDLLPVPRDPETRELTDEVPLIAPRTAKKCKLAELEHGVTDSLLGGRGTCQHKDKVHGPACGVGLTRLEEDEVGVWEQRGRWISARPRREHRTHLAIGFDTGTARPEYLYSREVLQEGQRFRGWIHCDDEATAETLTAELPGWMLSIGSGRSKGYGRVDINVARAVSQPVAVPDLARCNDHLTGLARQDLGDKVPVGTRLFTLTAGSPWAMRDHDGGHARTLSQKRLASALGLDAASVHLLAADARSEARSGWDGAAGLPTEVRHVVTAGSTFLCGATGLDDADLCARLTALAERGIGGQRLEGLGRVIVNHPLHFGGGLS